MKSVTQQRGRLLGLFLAVLAFPVLATLPDLSAAADQQSSKAADPWSPSERDKWQRPEEVMDELHLHVGSQVADVGCGSGYFTYHLAERVGPQGRVYAEDIEPELIRKLWHQALSKWLVQIKPVLGEDDNPRLPRQRLDAILLVHSYHEMRAHETMLTAFYRALRPGGYLGIIEFQAPDNQARDDSYQHHRIPPHTVREEITAQGFEFVGKQPGFTAPGSPPDRGQYFLLFEKPEENGP